VKKFNGDDRNLYCKIDMVILGLLSHEDLTGYDIKKMIDGAISFFWKILQVENHIHL